MNEGELERAEEILAYSTDVLNTFKECGINPVDCFASMGICFSRMAHGLGLDTETFRETLAALLKDYKEPTE